MSTRADRIKQAEDLRGELAAALAELNPNQETVLSHLRRGALEDLLRRLDSLRSLLAIEKHSLVFLGQVGVGKTTAICHLLGLTAQRTKRKRVGKTDKRVEVTEDLLATGSSFTTLCEVEILSADGLAIRVVPFLPSEMDSTIRDYCTSVWRKAYPQDGDDAEPVGFPPELVRAVRNMVGVSGDDIAIQIAQETGGFEEFATEIVSRAGLAHRSNLCAVPSSDCDDERAWIKNTFSALNLALDPSFPLPKRMVLELPDNLLDTEPDFLRSVIDTKGVDAGESFNRQDLDNHIRERPDSICILVEGFLSAPNNVAGLLERHVSPGNRLSASKFAVLVLSRGPEPEKVLGPTGPVDDREQGLSIRREQIEDILRSKRVNLYPEQLVFFDPLECYEASGQDHRLKADYDLEDVSLGRNQVFSSLNEIVAQRQEVVYEEVLGIKQSFEKIQAGKGLEPVEEDLVHECRARIQDHRALNLANADRFLDQYRGLWIGPQARNHMILRATNNRFGVYPQRNIDIYYDAIPIVENLVRQAAGFPKAEILKLTKAVRDKAPQESDLHELLNVLEVRISQSFDQVVQGAAQAMRKRLHEVVFHPHDDSNSFWVDVQTRFGQGGGFRDDVVSMYSDRLEDSEYERFLHDTVSTLWKELVIDPVLNYLQ